MSNVWCIDEVEPEANDQESLLTNDTALRSISILAKEQVYEKVLVPLERSLSGRTEESKVLLDAFQHVRDSGEAHAVLVRGSAGTGKTSLVNETLRLTVTRSGGMYVTGKFDQTLQQDPYFPIVAAFDDLCDLVIQGADAAETRTALNESLGDELDIFAGLIAGVSRLIGEGKGFQLGQEFGPGQAFIRFKQHCQLFLSSIASRAHPIVLFIDDLQFADAESLDVILFLMESRICNLLLVIAYRDDHIGLHEDVLLQKISKANYVTEITVRNLDLIMVNDMLSGLLDVDHQITQNLSSTVTSKTMGNPFYILQYLRILSSDGLLSFCETNQRWIWDEEKIQSETNVTRNFVEEITNRAKTVNGDVWTLLKLASLMGFLFETEVLMLVAEIEWPIDCCVAFKIPASITRDRVQSLLQIAEREGYIEKGKDGKHKWSHDEILQSFVTLIPLDQKARLHYTIGKQFVHNGEIPKTNRSFFVLDQLNMGIPCIVDNEERLWLAKMNLAIGNIAVSKSAFASGLQYFEKGISLLPEHSWIEHYNHTLQLFSGATEAASFSGNTTTAKLLLQVILDKGKTFDDKFPAYTTQVDILGTEGLVDQSIKVGCSVLKKMGVKIPLRPNVLHVIYEILRVKKSISKKSDEKILALPKMGKQKAMAMKIVSLLIRDAYFHSNELTALLSLRMMRLSLQYGLCEHSPMGFAMYGLICVAFENIEEGYRFGALSILLLDELHADEAKARVMTFVHIGIYHFKRPLHELTKSLQEGYRTGLKTGDITFGLMSGYNAGLSMLHCGAPLDKTLEHFSNLYKEVKEFNGYQILCTLCPFYQTALNLYGVADDPSQLTGDIMDIEETIQRLEVEKNELNLILTRVCCFQVAFCFESWYMADYYLEQLLRDSKLMKSISNFFASLEHQTLEPLFNLRRHRITGSRKYLQRYRKIKKLLALRSDQGVPSCKARLKLLDAEQKVLKGSKILVQQAFGDAIDAFSEVGYCNLSALANELAGNALLHHFSDKETASVFYNEAQSQYLKWKAFGKVDQMQRKCDMMIDE